MNHLTDEVTELFKKLFPICRSLTGKGVRDSLQILKQIANFDIKNIPSGTKCYDWEVPDEWNINDAYIKDSNGAKIIDFKQNNLHVVNYSEPIAKKMHFEELNKHLFTLPELKNAIPYRTSYYKRNWGFCMTHEQYEKLDRNTIYEVYIDSSLSPGNLTYGEALIQGESTQEYLISTYCCHPSLANDNLSGPILWTLLLREMQSMNLKHSYRFIIIPETIGSIAYLAQNEKQMQNINGAFVLTTVAGPGPFGYKQTFLNNHMIDKAVSDTFNELNLQYNVYPFDIKGSDETQFASPFFRIPCGLICKDKFYEYDYYHTSLDNLEFVSAKNLIETFKIYLQVIKKIECNLFYKSKMPYCEPMLSKRGLYPSIGGQINQKASNFNSQHNNRQYQISKDEFFSGNELDVIRWLMFYCDGTLSLFDIAENINISVNEVFRIAEKLRVADLLKLMKK